MARFLEKHCSFFSVYFLSKTRSLPKHLWYIIPHVNLWCCIYKLQVCFSGIKLEWRLGNSLCPSSPSFRMFVIQWIGCISRYFSYSLIGNIIQNIPKVWKSRQYWSVDIAVTENAQYVQSLQHQLTVWLWPPHIRIRSTCSSLLSVITHKHDKEKAVCCLCFQSYRTSFSVLFCEIEVMTMK